MFFRKKIPCYIIVYDEISVIKPSLEFLTKFSNELDIVIVENKSKNTPKIKKLVASMGDRGLLKRYYLFDQNIVGRAFDEVFMAEKQIISQSSRVIVTDGDLTVADNNWLSEEKSILNKNADVFTCAVDLSLENLPTDIYPKATDWIPSPRTIYKDFDDGITGVHLLMFRGQQFVDFLEWKWLNSTDRFHDSLLHQYCYGVVDMKWARTKKAKAYHHTWDLYRDKDHPYTKFKLSGKVAKVRKKSMQMSTSYKLTTFG